MIHTSFKQMMATSSVMKFFLSEMLVGFHINGAVHSWVDFNYKL